MINSFYTSVVTIAGTTQLSSLNRLDFKKKNFFFYLQLALFYHTTSTILNEVKSHNM